MSKSLSLLLAGSFVCLVSATSRAATVQELQTAISIIDNSELDLSSTRSVSNFAIEHVDLHLCLDSGRIAFFKPIVLDSTKVIFGCFFEGVGRFQFQPPIEMEKEQLRRFFGKDTLDRKFDQIYLLFSQEIYDTLMQATTAASQPFNKDQVSHSRKWGERANEDSHYLYSFEMLRTLQVSAGLPFLLACLEPDNSDRIMYMFDPYLQEEVTLQKRFQEVGSSFMETVCQYSQYNRGTTYANINGRNKDQIKISHYDVDAVIWRDGRYAGVTEVTCEVLSGPMQLADVELSPLMHIDSILDTSGNQLGFVRYELKGRGDYETWQAGVLFDHPLMAGKQVKLRFYLNGEVAKKEVSDYYLLVGADWYPTVGYFNRATFDMRFKTPKELTFVAAGVLVNEERLADTVVSTWKLVTPTSNVAFNLGYMKKYPFEAEDIAPVDVYFAKELHHTLGTLIGVDVPTGKDMEKQVAEDIQNALRVFSQYFGPYPFERMVVTEKLQSGHEAFPGFLHLGFYTWINTDYWGRDRQVRAHEVAHQWWGVGVSPATYHDSWLSEGFAEYSSLLYLQVIAGNDLFFDRLKEYRENVFSARKYLLGSGEESGPVALGYRTSSTKTSGDYSLVIYEKGACILHMLRNLLIDLKTMNEDAFFNMMKEFYEKNRGKSATTADFKRLTEKYVGGKMDWFFNQWVYRNELPNIEFTYTIDTAENKTFTANCKVLTSDVSPDFQVYIPLEIELKNGTKAYTRIFVDTVDFEFSLPGLPERPKKLYLNPFESVLARVKQ